MCATPAPIVAPQIFDQPYERYTAADHSVWATLYARQTGLLQAHACDAFLRGVEVLRLPADRVPNFETLNQALSQATGWRIVAVEGLIDDRDFFTLLASRQFPVTWWLRAPDSLDYLEEPDMFHDLFGHVPMLTDPVFAAFVQRYGQLGLAAAGAAELSALARLYWFTVEFGLLRDASREGGVAIYGAGIASSPGETRHSLSGVDVQHLPFDLREIVASAFRTDVFQNKYFVLEDFAQLFATLESAWATTIAAGERLAA